MSGFLYFLEEARESQLREILPMRGLGHVVSDGLQSRGCSTGPGAAAGIVVADRDRVPTRRVGFFPAQQIWRRVPGQEGAWVGVTDQSRPGPVDLARKKMLDGHEVELGDGNRWLVPVAMAWSSSPIRACGRLPCVMDLDADGSWVYGDVEATYCDLWRLAQEWTDTKGRVADYIHTHGTSEGLDDPHLYNDWVYARSVEILAVNYVIDQTEAALLGLFVTDRKWLLLDTLIDDQGLKEIIDAATTEVVEKKTDDTPATTPG